MRAAVIVNPAALTLALSQREREKISITLAHSDGREKGEGPENEQRLKQC